MFPFRWPASRWAQGILLGILATALTGAVSMLGWTQSIERNALDALFGARGPRFPHPKILIVAADNATVARVDQWPLPRALYAQVVRKLRAKGARERRIFLRAGRMRGKHRVNRDHARACREAGNVIHVSAFHVADAPNAPLPVNVRGDRVGLEKRFRVADAGAQCMNAAWVSSALPELRASAPAVGHVTVFPESDGTLRRIPHVIRYRGELYPSLALSAAAAYLGLRPPQVLAGAQRLRLPLPQGEQHVPLDAHGEAIVNWVGGNQSFPTFSMTDLLDGVVPDQALKDALIFVGVTAAGAYEQRATPFSPNQPAVELQANAADDILSHRPLREADPMMAWLLVLGFSMVAGLVASRQGWSGTLWFVLLAFLLWQGALIALRNDLRLPLATPLLAGFLTWMGAAALGYRQELEANWRADVAVSALARGGALLSSGREWAQLRDVICETGREALRAREVLLVFEGEVPASANSEDALSLQHIATQVTQSGARLRLPHAKPPKSEQTARPGRCISASLGPLLAVPLPHRTDNPGPQSLVPRHGVLIALRGLGGAAFTQRDEMLLETLAEQAALALSHLDYYEILRSKVELANRDLVQANTLLAEQGAKLAAAVQSINTALIVTDEKGRAMFCNAATGNILRDATPPLDADVAEHLRFCGLPQIADLCRQALSEGAQGDAPELRCEAVREIHDTQSERLISRSVLAAQITALHGADGRFLGLMLAVADITAQRDLDSMKTDFVSFVAHELRSPLTSILGYASLLQAAGDRFPAEQRSEMTQAITRQGGRLNRMIGELLDVSRLEAGKALDLRVGPLDLVALCNAVLEGQRAALQGKSGYQLQVTDPGGPAWIVADADRMEQIVVNLVSNAVKYSPDGGKICVDIEDPGGCVILRISDQGMGMAPEQMKNLFQKFYRTPDARRSGIKGTGLGLYLIKQLIEAHGGTISVVSAPGQGTAFTVELPKPEEK